MENAKSIIDIEVNDDQFKRFHELFLKYQKAVGDMPSVWKQTEDSSNGTTKNTDKVVKDTEKTVENERKVTVEKEKQEEVFNRIDGKRKEYEEREARVDGRRAEAEDRKKEADTSQLDAMRDMLAVMTAHTALMQEQTEEARKLEAQERRLEASRRESEKKQEEHEKRQNKLFDERHKGFKAMGGTLAGMIGSTMSIGLNIAKWGAGIGLGLLGGGFFGLERLAGGATAERTQSRGLGVTPGELRAWKTEFGNYGDPTGLLSQASNAPTDANARALFHRAGVSESVIRSGNTSQIAEQALRGLTDRFNRNQGPNAQAIWQGYGFDQIIGYNQMRQFAGASPSEREKMFSNLHSDMRNMSTGDPTMKAWQDFYTQLQRAGQELKTTFLDGLVKLSGPVGELSKNLTDLVRDFMQSGGFKEIITTVSHGLHDLSESMKDGSFKRGFDEFVSALNKFTGGGELERDLQTLEHAIHVTAQAAGTVFGTIEKSPAMGGSGWGNLQATPDGKGGFDWKQTDTSPSYGIGDIWDWIKSTLGPSEAHADTLGTARRLYDARQGAGSPSGGMSQYLAAIAQTESSGNPYAVSGAGAQGLFQLMPSVQKQYGVTNPFDPAQSARGASLLIRDLMSRFNGDMLKTTAAYNAGGGRVSGAIRRFGDDWLSHMPTETQQYVGRVASNFQAGGVNINIHNTTGGAATVTASQARAL